MRKLQSGGVTASKQPRNYTDLERWNRTLTCYSGIIAYRFMFLDSVSTHLRLEYEFQNKSKILLEKHADFNVTEFSDNKFFDVKSTLKIHFYLRKKKTFLGIFKKKMYLDKPSFPA